MFRTRTRINAVQRLKFEVMDMIREEVGPLKRGVTIREFAVRYNLHKSEVSNLLNGNTRVWSLDRLVMLLHALGREPRVVINERAVPSSDTPPSQPPPGIGSTHASPASSVRESPLGSASAPERLVRCTRNED